MPRKTVREMSDLEKRHFSLERKTFRSTIMGAIILGVAALLIGLGAYTYTLVHQYITEAYNLSKSVTAILHDTVDVEPLANDILADFRNMTDRMLEALNSDPAADPESVLKNVRGAVDSFVKDAEQFDDLTMLCVEYRGSQQDETQKS